MISRYTRLRVRRRIRNQRKQIERVGGQASEQFEMNVLDRWRNWQDVQRFVLGWLTLIALLIIGLLMQTRQLSAYHQTQLPVPGGTYREGVVGEITNMNPIFATRESDRAAARLIFSSLFSYDATGKVVGDLAESYKVDKDGTTYTVQLRKDVVWHDGDPFDAQDVVFTYEAIQHPDTRSYLNSAWRDVKVQAKDTHTVTFTLPNEYAPFIHSLTQGGIIPVHLLGSLNPAQLRGDEFNTSRPIGTGPFTFAELLGEATNTTINERQLRLDRFERYHRGSPKLDHFVLATFSDREIMLDRFLAGELAAAAGLETGDRARVLESSTVVWHDLELNNIVFLFFKTSKGVTQDKSLRQGLAYATDQVEILKSVGSRYALLDSPILPDQLGYNPKLTQAGYDPSKAEKALDKTGYIRRKGEGDTGLRYKGEKVLKLEIVTQNSDDYPAVAAELARQWRKVGVDAKVRVVAADEIQQNHISPHNYEALLFGVSMGPDPDPFVYWHSSQSGVNGFNLSEVENPAIDESLESGRTRSNKALREVKYQPFLSTWVDLTPALSLYRPAYSYAVRRAIDGFEPNTINSPEQRYSSVHLWQINTVEGQKPY